MCEVQSLRDRRVLLFGEPGTGKSTSANTIAIALANGLAVVAPGQKLAYATDLADTRENRERLIALARGAHTFFCEASFVERDCAQAARTGHLTARACGEIATAANVTRLIPFHSLGATKQNPSAFTKK